MTRNMIGRRKGFQPGVAVAPLLLAFLLVSCGRSKTSEQRQETSQPADLRSEFLRQAAGDPWARWPAKLQENSPDHGRPCVRVTSAVRKAAIALLSTAPAVAIDVARFQELTGVRAPSAAGTPFLLRGFATRNSVARVTVAGDAVIVYSDALGGLSDVRRHPCLAVLSGPPSSVYTMAAYDL